MLPLTILVAVGRMTHIRHPYLEPWMFTKGRLYPILGMFFVAEVMNATPHVLQNTLTGSVLHWGFTTTQQLSLFEMLGYVLGAAFTIIWGKGTPTWGRLPRLGFTYTRLLTEAEQARKNSKERDGIRAITLPPTACVSVRESPSVP